MNYNVIAYLIYLPISFYISVILGKVFYRNGRYFILEAFSGDETITNAINHFLLVGYYLLNLGYDAYSLSFWPNIMSTKDLINELSLHLGSLILGLGLVHYFNIYSIIYFSKEIKSLYTKV
jgi:hypothetical protein